MSDAAGADKVRTSDSSAEIDALLVRSIARWALVVSLLIFAFDIAVVASYPFPDALDPLRGPFYAVSAIALVAAASFIAFLGYRVVSMRVGGRTKAIYVMFLPAVALLGSLVGFLFLAAPR